jgi:hypothetical protein
MNMARGECTFKKRDVKEAIKATLDAGVEIARVEISKGRIVIITGKPNGTGQEGASEWDEK